MIHLPDVYTFHKRFVSALHDSLCNEVLKKGYNTEFSTIDQLYKTTHMIEEASRCTHGMRRAENTHSSKPHKARCAESSTPDGPVEDHHRERECSASYTANAHVPCTET